MYKKQEVIDLAQTHCEEHGKSAALFGRECGISASQMQYYFRGKRIPKDADMEKICFALRMPFEMVEKDAPKMTSKTTKSQKSNSPNGMYLEGNKIVDYFMKHANITNRSLMTTVLAMIARDTITYQGINNFDFETYVKEANNGSEND